MFDFLPVVIERLHCRCAQITNYCRSGNHLKDQCHNLVATENLAFHGLGVACCLECHVKDLLKITGEDARNRVIGSVTAVVGARRA